VSPTVLSWDAPLANCDGSPLTDLDHYELPVFRAVIIGSMACFEGSTDLCPVYFKSLVRAVAREPTIDLADPAPGEVLGYLEPIAVDTAGNTSEACP